MKKELKRYNEYKKKMIQLKREFAENIVATYHQAEEELLGKIDNSHLEELFSTIFRKIDIKTYMSGELSQERIKELEKIAENFDYEETDEDDIFLKNSETDYKWVKRKDLGKESYECKMITEMIKDNFNQIKKAGGNLKKFKKENKGLSLKGMLKATERELDYLRDDY